MKCLSWIVGVQPRPCQCFCKCIIVMLSKFIYELVIEFWAVTWGLGLRKWHKYQSHRHRIEDKSPQMHPCLVVGATGASQMHPCPYQGSV